MNWYTEEIPNPDLPALKRTVNWNGMAQASLIFTNTAGGPFNRRGCVPGLYTKIRCIGIKLQTVFDSQRSESLLSLHVHFIVDVVDALKNR
jgi:hypothetical protein